MLVKAFRLFVSSTFTDFVHERELLQSTIFPKLTSYCAARGYQFQAIDLRWGVNEEAHLDQRTADICLGEVASAKAYPQPNFLLMIGQRFGWVPLPFAIAQDQFDAILALLESRAGNEAVCADLRRTYQLDENHKIERGLVVAPADHALAELSAYTLLSREDQIVDLKDPLVWAAVEARMRKALQLTAEELFSAGRMNPIVHQKYFMSLTEQEVLEALPGYSRFGTKAPIDASNNDGDSNVGAIVWIRETEPRRRFFNLFGSWFRKSAVFGTTVESDERNKAAKLAEGVRRALPVGCITAAKAKVTLWGAMDQNYLDNFASTVVKKLETAVDQHIAAVMALEHSPDFELKSERAEHRAFADERRLVFIGLGSNRESIGRYITGTFRYPLVICGLSGTGKSALIANAVADAELTAGVPVIYLFVGASSASSESRTMLVSLIDDLVARGVARKPDHWEADDNIFLGQVRDALLKISKPVVVFLDGLDQLRQPGSVAWLPDKLPIGVRMVVSALEDPEFPADSTICKVLQQRLPADAFLAMEPLRAGDGYEILIALEQVARRRLQPVQRDYIVGEFLKANASPLYLRVAFTMACSWRSAEKVGAGGRELASPTTELISQFFDELSSVHHHESKLVARMLGLIAASRSGLSESELIEVLSRDVQILKAMSSEQHGARTQTLPVSVWVRLFRQLQSLLVKRRVDEQTLFHFFHREVDRVARQKYYRPNQLGHHEALFSYFSSHVKGNGDKAIYDRRVLSELLFQLHHAGHDARVGELLRSARWIEQKLLVSNIAAVLDDYQFAKGPTEKSIGQALSLASGVIARDTSQLMPQLLGRLRVEHLHKKDDVARFEEFLVSARRIAGSPALVPRWPTFSTADGPELARLEGHGICVNAVSYSPDGRTLASAGADKTVRLWDVISGEMRVFFGHTDAVSSIAVLPDGRYVVSGSYDRTLRLWDVVTGDSVVLAGHTDKVTSVSISTDGSRVVSGSGDRTVRLWDLATKKSRILFTHDQMVIAVALSPDGREVASSTLDHDVHLFQIDTGQHRVLNGHTDFVAALAFSANCARLASASGDKTIRLWSRVDGTSTVLAGHSDWIGALAFSCDDGRLISGSDDLTIRLWNFEDQTSTTITGHSAPVAAVAASPTEGGHFASGSKDTTARIWDLKRIAAHEANKRQLIKFPAHDAWIRSIAVAPDGSQILSGSDDNSLRLWNINGKLLREFNGHTDVVTSVGFSPNGHLAVSAAADRTARIWNTANGKSILLSGHRRGVSSVAIFPDGQHVLTGSHDKTLRLWTIDGTPFREFRGHSGEVLAVAISPEGDLFASGADDNTIRIWDVKSGASFALHGHNEAINTLAFSPDSRRILSGARDWTFRFWDIEGGNSRRIRHHMGWVTGVAFFPDGQHAITCSLDYTLSIRNANANDETVYGKEVARFDGDCPIGCLALLPDGSAVVAADDLGKIHLFDIRISFDPATAGRHSSLIIE